VEHTAHKRAVDVHATGVVLTVAMLPKPIQEEADTVAGGTEIPSAGIRHFQMQLNTPY
jgi:hypothetical protein